MTVAIAVIATSSAITILLGVPLPLVTAERWWTSLVGYILTPAVVIGAYGWNAVAQRDGLRRNPQGFVVRPTYTSALLWLVAASIVLGAWHAINLSVPLSEVIA